MVKLKKKLCKFRRDAWMYIEQFFFCMAPRLGVPIWGAPGAQLGQKPSERFQQIMWISLFLLVPIIAADLGVYSDSDDQRLTIVITPLPADSGYPFSLHRQVQLQCDIDTEPAIDIGSCGWRFNYGEDFLTNTKKYTLYVHPSRGTVHTLTMILTINGITEDELGFYTCEGKNSAGLRKSSTVELAIVAEDTVGIKDPDYEGTTTDMYSNDYGTNGTSYNETTTMDPTDSSAITLHSTIGRKLSLCIACLILTFILK